MPRETKTKKITQLCESLQDLKINLSESRFKYILNRDQNISL